MAKKGKRYIKVSESIDRDALYSLEEAIHVDPDNRQIVPYWIG